METNKQKVTCIMCPMGCDLTVEKNGETFTVSGNTCGRGKTYGIAEVTAPIRMVTSLVKYKDAVTSVKTSAPIPKDKIAEVLKHIKTLNIQTTLECGDVVLKNVANTGADVVVTGNLGNA
ncbi:MAG: DUF1667 domain-containing protein [Bacillota bacterium]